MYRQVDPYHRSNSLIGTYYNSAMHRTIKFSGIAIASVMVFLLVLINAHKVHAETYTINGSKGKTKLDAIVAMASNKNAKVERCKYTEKQDSNDGSVLCRAVELSPRGTLRLQK